MYASCQRRDYYQYVRPVVFHSASKEHTAQEQKGADDVEWEVLTKGLSHRGGGAGSRQGQSAGLRKNGPCVRQGVDGVVKVSVHCSLEMFLNIKTAAQLAQKAAVPLGIF